MQKVMFGIFAHPDDEAFGPSGKFIKEVHDGAELHLITLTLGQNGTNPDSHDDLGAIRKEEWLRGGELMGATSQHELGYTDGHLCNTEMIEAAEKIEQLVNDITDRRDVQIEFVTFDLNGISGHIDHIVASRAACLAFYRLKRTDARLARICLLCLPLEQFPETNTDWLYMEAGRPNNEIDEVVDAREYRKEIIEVMRAHHTQRADGETHIKQRGDELGVYHFVVKD